MAATTNYEKEVCGRCGGTGKYSWCEAHRDTCFGCAGTGERLTKRGQAAKAFADDLLSITIAEFAALGEGRTGRTCVGAAGQWATIDQAVRDERPLHARINGGEATPLWNYTVSRKGKALVSLPGSRRVRLTPTEEQIDQINAYQATLTKAGKPRKRP
ncbi:hypothetical protein LCM08_06315 [Salipiger pacificus]|nr:hypothetical protein [Alloyangia pacifica]